MATAGTFAADAAIRIPGCPDLTALGQQIALNQMVPINPSPSRFTIPAAFATPRFENAFGAPAVDWSPGEVAAAIKATADCINAAKKARNTADAGSLTTLWRSLGGLRSTVGAITASEPRLDAGLKQLLEDAPSRAVLYSLIIVASVRDGSSESMQKTAQAFRDSAARLNLSEAVHSHAQYVLRMMSDVPAKSWARVFPGVDNRLVVVRQWVIDDANQQINATPETVQGVAGLGRLRQKARAELAGALPVEELAKLDAAATARRAAIEDALVAHETARIDAIPATAEGLNQLLLAQRSEARTVLSSDRVAALDSRIAARREMIGSAVTDEQIKGLDRFPDTMAGLTELDRFKNGTIRGLQGLAGLAAAERFGAAATQRATKIGEAAFGPFRSALADMPATDEGLAELDNALTQIKGPIEGLEPPVRARYIEAAATRRQEIVKAVEREDARLAKLPLAGGVFVDREAQAKFEFRSRSRVYVTAFNETIEAGYEADGDRVIIRLPNGNQVFTRQGAWIRGYQLNLKRQAEK